MRTHGPSARATYLMATLLGACSTIDAPHDAGVDAPTHDTMAPDARGDGAVSDTPHIGPPDGSMAMDAPNPLDVPTAADVPPPDNGPPRDAAAECDATCPAYAHCVQGVCQCDPYFLSQGASCEPIVPLDPAGRTDMEVCDQLRNGAWAGGGMFVAGTGGMCDAGGLDRGAVDEALAEINTYRWLVGLSPVTDDASCDARDQQCSMMESMHGFPNGTFDPHHPSSSWTCYTPEGAGAAGMSNIAWGVGSAADSIGVYISDYGNETTLGHRRWVLSTNLGGVGIGYYSGASCLGVFGCAGGIANPVSPPWHAYPPPGPAPMYTLSGIWSWHAGAYAIQSDATVTMSRASDGSALPVNVVLLPDGYGDPTISWTPMGWTPAAGETYHVTITGLAGGGTSVSYDVRAIDCP